MRKPLEMYVALFLQSMVQIRGQNVGFKTKLLLGVELLGVAWRCLELPGVAWRCLEMHRAAEIWYVVWTWYGSGRGMTVLRVTPLLFPVTKTS